VKKPFALTATLDATQVAQDFAAMLPLTLPWFCNAGIEYTSELSALLTETGAFYGRAARGPRLLQPA
jgi:hypothetical protein